MKDNLSDGWGKDGKRTSKIVKRAILYTLFFYLILLMMFSYAAAITGTGSSISMHSSIGSVSFDTNISGLHSATASTPIIGDYSSILDTGHFDYMHTSTALVITLVSPIDNSGSFDVDMNLIFDLSAYANNCSIIMDNSIIGTLYGLNKGEITVPITNMNISRHYWNVSCYLSDTEAISETRDFTIIKASSFDNETTDLNTVDISNITNLTISTNEGKISFTENINLSNGANLDSYVHILPGSIIIDSASLPQLNKSAILTIKNIPYQYIVLLKDGPLCPSCTLLSNSQGQVMFSVLGFSNYTVTSTAKLQIYSISQNDSEDFNRTILFVANYTNRTSYEYINAACKISLNYGGWTPEQDMTFNASSKTYEFFGSFNETGLYDYHVNCTPSQSGFDTLSLNDIYSVKGTAPESFATLQITEGNSSRMNITNIVADKTAAASNVTGLFFEMNTVTKTWQGYYGNVTGAVMLRNANGTHFYDWKMASPSGEIYASRSAIISWSKIRCANQTELDYEDNYLGITNNDSDSITRTFFNTTKFKEFYTGYKQINSSNDCYATNLYDYSGPQNNSFSEILLSDDRSMVYSTLIDNAVVGFDNNKHDFEIMVGVNGNTGTNLEAYYFFIEIG